MSRPLADVLTALACGALLGALCSCSHKVDTAATLHEALAEVQDTTAAREVVSHVVEAAGRETVTVEEFAVAPGETNQPDVASTGEARAPKQASASLVRRTVTVKDTGPITRDTRSDSQRATETHESVALDSKATTHVETRAGTSWLLWLAIGSGGAVAVAIGWQFRPPWMRIL